MKVFLSELRLYFCNHLIANIPSNRIRLWFYKKIMDFKIGKGTSIFMKCKFDCAGGLIIGNNSVINSKSRLDSRGGLVIGNNVVVSDQVIFLTADHDDWLEKSGRIKKIVIKDYAWFGTRAMILPGITIGKGGVVAAGAIVTKDVNTLEVVGGIPAKKINTRPAKFNYNTKYKRLFQ